ncbi:MAG TPA: DUF4142 domain-containing protein [Thermoanaerobaculia bacterium]|jgi:putative membrane protein|nr:DUF4142 domain-containing protein [Thermoanaerobaculia bacterium]
MNGTRMASLLAAAAALTGGIAFAQGRAASSAPPPPDATKAMEGASTATESRMSSMSTSTDHAFAMKAARGGMAEVELGKIASANGSDESVKQFGQRMVDDHSKANDELKGIASSKGLALPSSVSGKDRKTAERLRKMNGASFDRAYMKDMVADHEADVAEFEREARSGKDPELKAFAEKTLPTLKEHLQMAKDAASKVGATPASTRKRGSTPSS